MTRNLSFLLLAGALILVMLTVGIYYAVRLRASAQNRVGHSVAKTQLSSIVTVLIKSRWMRFGRQGSARTDDFARELEPDEIWKILGELDGVKRLESNSRVLVEMATYLQRSYPEATAVAEELRLHARELEWQVGRLGMAAEQGSLEFHIATYAQNVAVAYYLMEQRLQSLCQQTNMTNFRPVVRHSRHSCSRRPLLRCARFIPNSLRPRRPVRQHRRLCHRPGATHPALPSGGRQR